MDRVRSVINLLRQCAFALALAGCASVARDYPPPPFPLPSDSQPEESLGETDDPSEGLVQLTSGGGSLSGTQEAPRHILVLSGGGVNGAFTAGVLAGWSESGTRPQFDIVTGISTGALVAPFAFLGREYDGTLQRVYTSKEATQVYSPRPLLFWSDALASSEPLRKRIENEITDELLRHIAVEHRRGRRLFAGTTSLDSQELVVWDLGAIAAGDDPNRTRLFRDVLLASCSVPGLLPPVPINIQVEGKPYTELHVDGSVSTSMLLLPQMLGIDRQDVAASLDAANSHVYVIVAGKAIPDRMPVERELLQITGASLQGVLKSLQTHELNRIQLLTQFTGATFHLAAIPPHILLSTSSLKFDIETMQRLYRTGREIGSSSDAWLAKPPGVAPGEGSAPRTGSRIVVRPSRSQSDAFTFDPEVELKRTVPRSSTSAVRGIH
ncbi:patatin-like phospholipase family protein [Planctomyces sp. SH-PL14]|uniref:patatin-like phospholipase family protein n=1 Tax=Planctomyces sp. SH-PL14 TaxID=1632864 RepID=UPI00078DFBFA|nr:patatin-like phospholipase family protein [Planctomyces sp. SH-PL14]AMV21134.1 Patatin-like phospholipase [Planctomyces sp. SH-PL14]